MKKDKRDSDYTKMFSDELIETVDNKENEDNIECLLKVFVDGEPKNADPLTEIPEPTEKQKFDVLAVPCDRVFVVAPEKTEEFKNAKPNPEVRQQMKKIVKKLKVNNLVEEGPTLVKKKRK